MRLIVPITTWIDKFALLPWIVQIQPNSTNGLSNVSGFNIQQARYLSTKRFQNKIGIVEDNTLFCNTKSINKLH